MLSHTAAKNIVDGLGVTENQSLFLRGVALHETSYGAGWKAGQGAGSHNMGAITTNSPDSLSFKHEDSLFDSKLGKVRVYTTWFAGYPSDEAGFSALKKTVLKPNVAAALAGGDFERGVRGMYANSYFMGVHPHTTDAGNEQNVADYLAAVRRSVQSIGNETGESEPVPLGDSRWQDQQTGSSGSRVFPAVALALAGLWLGRKLLRAKAGRASPVS